MQGDYSSSYCKMNSGFLEGAVLFWEGVMPGSCYLNRGSWSPMPDHEFIGKSTKGWGNPQSMNIILGCSSMSISTNTVYSIQLGPSISRFGEHPLTHPSHKGFPLHRLRGKVHFHTRSHPLGSPLLSAPDVETRHLLKLSKCFRKSTVF